LSLILLSYVIQEIAFQRLFMPALQIGHEIINMRFW